MGEDEDDGYAYYYARVRKESTRLTFMQCSSLPESLRTKLTKRGDLTADDEEFETCNVNTVRGLRKAARAYHRGKAVDEEALTMEMTPIEENAATQE